MKEKGPTPNPSPLRWRGESNGKSWDSSPPHCGGEGLGVGLLLALLLLFLPAGAAFAQEPGVIDGVVLNGTAGANAPADLEVVVHVLQNRVKTGEHRVRTNGLGQFGVEGMAPAAATLYFPIVQYSGVAYYPDRPIVLDGAAPARTEITVYEGTLHSEGISFDRLNMLVMNVTPSALSIMEMGAVVNGGDRTFAADPSVTGSARTLRFNLPTGAIDVTPQTGLPADSLESTADGFASTDPVRPGRREIAFSYDLPYTASSLELTRTFAFPVGTFTLYLPSTVDAIVPNGVALPGTAELGGRQFRQYAVTGVAPGAEVRFRLTGLPAPLFATPRALGMAVVAAAGVPLIGFLAFALWRRRRAEPAQQTSDSGPTQATQSPGQQLVSPSEDGRLALLREVAQLDARFESGELDEATYRAERARRKAQLLAQTPAPASVP